jgi:transcription antitermination protein NusB
MTRRSRAREVALQLLFQYDLNKTGVPRAAIERFAKDRLPADPQVVPWCLALYDGVLANRPAIDVLLAATAANWRLTRMLPVDRNVLRLGAYELLHDTTRPPVSVVIDEMIELSRRFGSADSPAFVNGILDKISKSRSAEVAITESEVPSATDGLNKITS